MDSSFIFAILIVYGMIVTMGFLIWALRLLFQLQSYNNYRTASQAVDIRYTVSKFPTIFWWPVYSVLMIANLIKDAYTRSKW